MQKPLHFSLVVIAVCCSPAIFSQSPGNTSTGLKIWLDAGVNTTLAGSNIISWGLRNRSGAVSQADPAMQPLLVQNSVNFHPSVLFDGGDNLVLANQDIEEVASSSGNVSMYVVGKRTAGTDDGVIVMWDGNFNISKLSVETGQAYIGESGFMSTAATLDTFSIAAAFQSVSANARYAYGNDQLVTTLPSTAVMAGSANFWVGAINGLFALRGNVAEIVFYGADHSGAAVERQMITSYLAVKYGIQKAGDYLNGAGMVTWNATANEAYHHDVFGIARDDASGLLQQQSNSVNTGSGDGTGQSGKGNLVITNPSHLDNNESLLIGHNTNDFSVVPLNLSSLPLINARINRSWKLQLTGNVGTITLKFDMTALPSPFATNPNPCYLLIDENGDGDFNTGTVIAVEQSSRTGDVLEFNSLALSNGVVLSFGTQMMSLPVTLKRFDATKQDDNALLHWVTASEQNSHRFEVEQSVDGLLFKKIAELPAAGNSQRDIDYYYTDRVISRYGSNKCYYRLKQVDNDGRFEYSRIVTLHIGRLDDWNIYPLPFKGTITIDVPPGVAGAAKIQLTDMTGRTILNRQEWIGNNQASIVLTGLGSLQSGSYLLSIKTDRELKTVKLIRE